MILSAQLNKSSNLPILPAEIPRKVPYVGIEFGIFDSPFECRNILRGLLDSGSMTNTWLLSDCIVYMRKCPEQVAFILDAKDGKYRAIPLVGAVNDPDIVKSLSTFLPVLVGLRTMYRYVPRCAHVIITFLCDE